MNTIRVYRCLCDVTRLRILNLLLEGPLCVCHLAGVLELEQPKVSRHLKSLRDAGMITTERCYNWTICRIPENPNNVLEANLKCLQDMRGEEAVFQMDLNRRKQVLQEMLADGCSDLPSRLREIPEGAC